MVEESVAAIQSVEDLEIRTKDDIPPEPHGAEGAEELSVHSEETLVRTHGEPGGVIEYPIGIEGSLGFRGSGNRFVCRAAEEGDARVGQAVAVADAEKDTGPVREACREPGAQ
jgi:hypothetical protein